MIVAVHELGVTLVLADFGISALFIAISVGLSLLAGALLKPKKTDSGPTQEDDTSPSTATRGAFVPIVLGTRRVGPVICWVNRGKAVRINNGGGDQYLYRGNAFHVLTIGPGRRFIDIRQDNTVIYKPETPLTPATHPSGTIITIPKRRDGNYDEQFAIYWGEVDQPVNHRLAGKTSFPARSRWPHIMYVEWIIKDLGYTRRWPDLQYTITAGCASSLLSGAGDYELDDSTSVGVNAAHALFQLCTGPFPHGAGMPLDWIDTTTLAAVGQLVTTEHLPANIIISDGDSLDTAIDGFNADIGMMTPTNEGRIVWMPMRDPTGSVPSIDDDVVAPDRPELNFDNDVIPVDRPMFTFNDEKRGYREMDINLPNDGGSNAYTSPRTKKLPIYMATHSSPANKIANRRSQEELGIQTDSSLSVLRGARRIVPGQPFDFDGVRYIAKANTPDGESPTNKIVATVDSYNLPVVADEQTPEAPDEPSERSSIDLGFTFFEIPSRESGTSQPTIIVFRARANQGILSAGIWLSQDNVSYIKKNKQQSAAASGLLTSAITGNDGDEISSGPTFQPETEDAALVPIDLTGDDAGYESGEQLCAIDNEIFYIRKISPVAETAWASGSYTSGDYVIPNDSPLEDRSTGLRYIANSTGTTGSVEPEWPGEVGETVVDGTVTWEAVPFEYQITDMIPARYGTEAANHSIGARVYIIPREQIVHIRHALIEPGITLYLKTQPFTQFDEVSLSDVTAVSKMISGQSTRGVPTGPLWTDDTGNYVLNDKGKTILFWANLP